MKKNSSAEICSRDGRSSVPPKFTREFLTDLLLQYPIKDQQAASDMVIGFQEAMHDIEDLDIRNMDKMFKMLYLNIIALEKFSSIESRLAAITLAKFFLENFHYLPTASIPLIEHKKESKNIPLLVGFHNHSSINVSRRLQEELHQPIKKKVRFSLE